MPGSCMKAFQCSVETALPERCRSLGSIFTSLYPNTSDTIWSNYEPINRDKRIHFPSYLSFPFLFKMLIWLWMFQHRTPQRTQTSNVMTTTSHFFSEGLITTCGSHLLVIIWWGMRFPLLELHPQTDIIASHGVVEGH